VGSDPARRDLNRDANGSVAGGCVLVVQVLAGVTIAASDLLTTWFNVTRNMANGQSVLDRVQSE